MVAKTKLLMLTYKTY